MECALQIGMKMETRWCGTKGKWSARVWLMKHWFVWLGENESKEHQVTSRNEWKDKRTKMTTQQDRTGVQKASLTYKLIYIIERERERGKAREWLDQLQASVMHLPVLQFFLVSSLACLSDEAYSFLKPLHYQPIQLLHVWECRLPRQVTAGMGTVPKIWPDSKHGIFYSQARQRQWQQRSYIMEKHKWWPEYSRSNCARTTRCNN